MLLAFCSEVCIAGFRKRSVSVCQAFTLSINQLSSPSTTNGPADEAGDRRAE